jgi:hypothetical protein
VEAISNLATGMRAAVARIFNASDSVPIQLRVFSGSHRGATCWVDSNAERDWSVFFDFEKRE